jgi:hypothetical protein
MRLFLLSLFFAAPLFAQAPTKQLRAGAAVVDVTPDRLPVVVNCMFPERTANVVTDRLHARGIVFDDGNTKLAIVIVDSCMMPRELIDVAKQLAHEATGIPIENMLVAATHTHSAPSVMGCLGSDADQAYPEFLTTRIARCIIESHKNLAPARVGWTVTQAPNHTHNRRWVLRPDKARTDPFGAASVRAHMHPGYQNPDFVGPSGPVDSTLTLLSVQTPDGRPVALLANYSMHYFGSTPVSADYFGAFAEKVAKRIAVKDQGRNPVVMMSQGTSGDLMWMDYGEPEVKRKLDEYAGELAEIALEAYRKIEYRDTADLAMREAKLTLARRTPDAARLKWAREQMAKLGGKKPTAQPEIYAREQVFLHEEPTRELKLQAVRVGGFGIAAIPNEVFALTGLRIKAHSPLAPTAVIELANGADGYIPPPAQHALGGYTTWPARTAGLEVQAEPKIVDSVLDLLEGVSGKKRRVPVEPDGLLAKGVKARKPVAYWRLDEFHGPRVVDAIGSNHATYEDGIAHYLSGPIGAEFNWADAENRCAHFAGGRVAARVKELGERYSVEMWLWNGMPTNARAVTGYCFSRGPGGAKEAPGDHLGIGGTHSHAGKLIFFNGNDRNQVLGGKTVLALRRWYHVVLVRDGKSVTVYLDGKPEITGEVDVTTGRETTLFIGGRSDNFANFAGKIDEVAIYDRVLTAAEVKRPGR